MLRIFHRRGHPQPFPNHRPSRPAPGLAASAETKRSLRSGRKGDSSNPDGVVAQAAAMGCRAGIFNTPQIEDTYFFNPSLAPIGGEMYLIARRTKWNHGHWKLNECSLSAFPIYEDMSLGDERKITYPVRHQDEQLDDPRVAETSSGLLLSLCTWISRRVIGHQSVCHLGEGLTVSEVFDPCYGANIGVFGNNRSHEKNWVWFDHDGDLFFVYMTRPHEVCRTENFQVVEEFKTGYDSNWGLGHQRGGTPPVRIGNEYLSFFHSSVHWKTDPVFKNRNKYFMGAYTFKAAPPFNVSRMTTAPLLTGSSSDPMIEGSPRVVFPCGSSFDGDKWLVSFGINDCASGWVEIPHNHLNTLLKPVA